jgi:hypothetical protein
MKKQSPTFESEGTQPDYIRDLLDAGRDAAKNDPAVRGYDVEAGIARHAALVQAGTAIPPWAEQLVASGSGAAAGAGVGIAANSVAKLATGKLVAGVALAVIAAGTIAAMVIGAPEKSAHVAPPQAPLAPTAPEAAKPIDQAAPQAAHESATTGETVEILDIAPITARAKRDLHDVERADNPAPELGSKPAAARTNAQGTKSLDALMDAVGKQSSKGHVDLVAPSNAVTRSGSQARAEQASTEQSSNEPASAAVTPAPAPVVDDARLEREMGMLAVAQRVLKSDPERALRLAQQGEKEFTRSMFTQERQQVLLLALIELGRIGEAKRLALPYLKRYPNGPFSDRLRSALAAAKPEN